MLNLRTARPNASEEELFGADADFPLEKTIMLNSKSHFDYLKRKSTKYGLMDYEVYKVVSKWHSKVLRLRYSDYIKFVNVDCKHKDAIYELVLSNLPGLSLKNSKKKKTVTE